jgi:hypothetical protein
VFDICYRIGIFQDVIINVSGRFFVRIVYLISIRRPVIRAGEKHTRLDGRASQWPSVL